MWLYVIISVLIVSAIAFVGILTLPLERKGLKWLPLFLVALAAGTLLGDVFFHLLPETIEKFGFQTRSALYVLSGFLIFFAVEKYVQWRHCHDEECKEHPKSFGIMNLLGDALHNFLDGAIIAGSYLVNLPLGITTTIAVVTHEIPQEMADFGVLIHSGYTRIRALFLNFFTAMTAVLGAILTLIISDDKVGLTEFLVPFTIGAFIYIAGSDLIPEIHKESRPLHSLLYVFAFILGIFLMYSLLPLK